MNEQSFAAYNTFLFDARPDRIAKILARYELYKGIIDLPGDIVECGVFHGQGLLFWAKLIQIFNPLSQRRVVGFDTFSGVPETVINEIDRLGSASFRDYENVPEKVLATAESQGLSGRIVIVPGDASVTIPKFVAENRGFRVALLNLDFDVYEPTKAALNALYPKVVSGGTICFDEYAVHQWGESDAVDEFFGNTKFEPRSIPWAMSPTAFIVK
jgi:hypothetical protein